MFLTHLTRICLLVYFLPSTKGGDSDYWSEDFDTSRNCKQKDRINSLREEEYKPENTGGSFVSHCSSEIVREGEDKYIPFRKCKMNLSKQLQEKCSFTSLESTGELLYCYDRGIITCCFDKHTCVKDWLVMQDKVYKTAKLFLMGPTNFLEQIVKPIGYSTCRKLGTSLDTSLCAKDCEQLSKNKFAKDCKKKGGFFKCCIRRDSAFCHECRFCCTLPMCTYPTPSLIEEGVSETVFDTEKLVLKDQQNLQTASELFMSRQHIYKSWDYRCIAPNTDKEPAKWKSYDMHGFRKAFNEETLKKVDTFKYNPLYNNWMDPKILKAFTIGKGAPRKPWKSAYGFPYVKRISWDGATLNSWDSSPCHLKCAAMEMSKFAKSCKKMGGFFKCCVTPWTLNIFETARNKLISEGMIQDKTTRFCRPGRKHQDPCMTCSAEGACTKRDEFTGKPVHIFMTKYKKEHKVGGPDQSPQSPNGMRLNWCEVGDRCQLPFAFEYSSKTFQGAVSKKQLCRTERFATISEPEMKQSSEFENYCMKSNSNVDFPCPKEILDKVTDENLPYSTKANLVKMNKDFSNFIDKKKKKSAKKKKKKNGKKKKKKKKGKKKKRGKNKKKKRRKG